MKTILCMTFFEILENTDQHTRTSTRTRRFELYLRVASGRGAISILPRSICARSGKCGELSNFLPPTNQKSSRCALRRFHEFSTLHKLQGAGYQPLCDLSFRSIQIPFFLSKKSLSSSHHQNVCSQGKRNSAQPLWHRTAKPSKSPFLRETLVTCPLLALLVPISHSMKCEDGVQ